MTHSIFSYCPLKPPNFFELLLFPLCVCKALSEAGYKPPLAILFIGTLLLCVYCPRESYLDKKEVLIDKFNGFHPYFLAFGLDLPA